MCTLSLTGKPKFPHRNTLLLLLLVFVTLFLHGCGNRTYRAVPQCEPERPPKAEQFVKATPDEKLVLMTNAYIKQTKVVVDCNEDIQLINAANKAVVK